jgi:hypothetical protein
MKMDALTKQELRAAAIRSIVGAIPYIGPALNEAIFETRSRIKQQRINHFVDLLIQYFEQHGNEGVNLALCETEEFSDLLERTLTNVARSRSVDKALWFRNILINQVTTGNEVEKSELCAEILDSLKDKQVKILDGFKIISNNGVWEANAERLRSEAKLEELMEEMDLRRETGRSVSSVTEIEVKFHQAAINRSRSKMVNHSRVFDSANYGCSSDEFQYYLQDLTNKSLLIDLSHKYGATPLSVLKTTNLGNDLLTYIMLSSE